MSETMIGKGFRSFQVVQDFVPQQYLPCRLFFADVMQMKFPIVKIAPLLLLKFPSEELYITHLHQDLHQTGTHHAHPFQREPLQSPRLDWGERLVLKT